MPQGYQFPDGTIQTTAANLSLVASGLAPWSSIINNNYRFYTGFDGGSTFGDNTRNRYIVGIRMWSASSDGPSIYLGVVYPTTGVTFGVNSGGFTQNYPDGGIWIQLVGDEVQNQGYTLPNTITIQWSLWRMNGMN